MEAPLHPDFQLLKLMKNQEPNQKPETPNFKLIYAYTRKQALADGAQIEVTKTAQEAGIKFPTFITPPKTASSPPRRRRSAP